MKRCEKEDSPWQGAAVTIVATRAFSFRPVLYSFSSGAVYRVQNEPGDFVSTGRPVSPEILPYEIGNALTAMIKSKQLTHDEALSTFTATSQIPVRLLSVFKRLQGVGVLETVRAAFVPA